MRKSQRAAVVLLFVVAGIFAGFQVFKEFIKDPDTGKRDTRDLILAIKQKEEGSQIVLLKEDGTVEPSPNYSEGATDKEAVWRPDGQRVFFLSDRQEGAFLLHRWNVAANSSEARSAGTRSVTSIYWGPFGDPNTKSALITQGGFVLSYDPREAKPLQMLPPRLENVVTNEEGGSTNQFDVLYQKLGNAFVEAKRSSKLNTIAAIMKNEEGLEVLIIQRLDAEERNGKMQVPLPLAVAKGKNIDFDISVDGKLVASIIDFDYPMEEMIPPDAKVNGVVKKPFKNGLVMLDLAGDMQPKLMVDSPDNKLAFVHPKLSPDGQTVALLAGEWSKDNQFASKGLFTMPYGVGGGQKVQPITQGNIVELNWHPSGDRIVYVARQGQDNVIFTASASGGGEKQISKSGTFSTVSFSPQMESK